MRTIALLFDPKHLGAAPWRFESAVRTTRRLSDMPDYFAADAAARVADPLIYEVFDWPERAGLPTDLMVTLTAIQPGSIGGLAHHTKGHFHQDPDGAELVMGVAGNGRLELVDRQCRSRTLEFGAGTCITVEPGWAHRVLNPGTEPLLYLSVSSAFIGHDYAGVQAAGWMPGLGGPNEAEAADAS